MQATVRRDLVSKFQKMVTKGCAYVIESVVVGFNDGPFKLISHKHKLAMMGHSKFTKINTPEIPMNVFEFMTLKEVLSCTKEEKAIGRDFLF
jgi:hypothetical protein